MTAAGRLAYDGVSDPSAILTALQLKESRPVIVVIGWAATPLPPEVDDRVGLLFARVARVADICGAAIVTGGTDAGVMAGIGRAVAGLGLDVPLIGVAPKSKLLGWEATDATADTAAPEPHHKIVGTPGTVWGDEGPALIRLAEALSEGHGVVVLAVGGGKGTQVELDLAARREWPTIAIAGVGGVTEVAPRSDPGSDTRRSRIQRRQETETQSSPAACGPMGVDVSDLGAVERLLCWRFSSDDLLKQAWMQFARSDRLASSQKKPTSALIVVVLALGTLTILCATAGAWLAARKFSWINEGIPVGLRLLVTALPLVAGVFLGIVDIRSRKGSWIRYRSAAGAILAEIYRYRARAGAYADGSEGAVRAALAVALNEVDTVTGGRHLVTTGGVRYTNFWPPTFTKDSVHRADSLVGPLTARTYDEHRVQHQIDYFEGAVSRSDDAATRASVALFSVAAAAAFFIAISWRWNSTMAAAAIFASAAAAMISLREYRQRDDRAEDMLMACVAIRAARGRWLASMAEAPQCLGTYAEAVEQTLAAESVRWDRAMKLAQDGLLSRHKGR